MSQSLPNQSESTSRKVWQLAWPTILSNLLFTTVGFAHIRIAAELGTSAVAAVTTGHRVFFLIQAVLMGLSVAATATVARAWGAEQVRQAERAAWSAMQVSVIFAALLALPTLLVPTAIASLFSLDEPTTLSASGFIFWLGVFSISSALNMMLSTALRATGDVITPLWFLLASSILNITFGVILALGYSPLPAMGVSGIALGGGSAGFTVTLVFLAFWWRGRFKLLPLRELAVNMRQVKELITIGAPAMVEQAIIQLSFLVFFGILAHYGTNAYAAYGIGISIVSFPIVIGFGFGIAAATLVGQQLGAGRPELAVAAGWRSLRLALLAMVSGSIVLVVFADPLARFMIDDPEVVHFTKVFLYMIAAAQPMMACEMALAGALRGAGDTRFPLFSTFCGLMLGRLIPAWVFFTLGLSVYWIFAVMLFDYSLKAILLIHRYRSHKWLDIKVGTGS
ncbi:MATE family efflux transporter [Halioglobus pacificus]|uniref:Multidrug-efflux transporter n=1 Tax=Parahalioglobus pacificus TaxID=930806 RepID=A0A918XLW2_9GAMM|nr:MATE family efflux transporter [Halioglobus pacificus]GHD38067.1 MATE family efflux transporter [Halioglobus pacificus]